MEAQIDTTIITRGREKKDNTQEQIADISNPRATVNPRRTSMVDG